MNFINAILKNMKLKVLAYYLKTKQKMIPQIHDCLNGIKLKNNNKKMHFNLWCIFIILYKINKELNFLFIFHYFKTKLNNKKKKQQK